ncbi:MAG TPA: TOMM precursor leader peptide-binding protein [Opitutus sp.]|nr:TOMM precursor leader peptide-binding protein [Opitutus sp.]
MLPQSVVLSPFWTLLDFNGTRHAVADHAAAVVHPGLTAAVLDRVSDNPADVSSLAAGLGAQGTAAEVYFAILRLIDAGILCDAGKADPGAGSNTTAPAKSPPDENGAASFTPQPPASPARRRIFIDAANPRLRTLVAHHAVEAGHAIAAALEAAEVQVLVVDHYFAPAVARRAADARAAGREFLVAKLHGLEPWVGPQVAREGRPCFACLLSRLRGNQLLREQALLGPRPYRCPVVPALESEAARFLIEKLASANGAGDAGETGRHGRLWTWTRATSSWRDHAIIRRPQCAICGAKAWPLLPDVPDSFSFTLHSRPKVRCDDGTHRTPARPDVLQQMEAHLDPLTGTVGEIWAAPDVPEYLGFHSCATFAYGDRPLPVAVRQPLLALGPAGGKGRTPAQARVGTLAEACERFALLRYASDQAARRSLPHDLPGHYLLPETLLGFSPRQYRNRSRWPGLYPSDYVPPPRARDRPIAWVSAWSLVHERPVHVPRAFVATDPDREEASWSAADSNGFAAGATLEAAIVQAACELIERDGVGLWWHHRAPRPGLEPDTVPNAFYQGARAGLDRDGFDLHVLDVATELAVPAFVAIAVERATGEIVPGFGAHLDPTIALERAVAELGQIWNARKFQTIGEAARACGHPELLQHAFLRPASDRPLRPWSALRNLASPDDVRADIATLVRIFATHGFDFLVVDASLPDLPVAVAKAIVPGLVHYFPRFGIERLYTAPVQLGWLAHRPSEESLNPVPMVI